MGDQNDHQMTMRDPKKSPLNEIDVQMAPIDLFLIILIGFMMIYIMKDPQLHLAQNLSFCYTVTEDK